MTLALVLICGMAALAIDWAYLSLVRTELQATADSAALAGAMELVDKSWSGRASSQWYAQDYAQKNQPGKGTVLSSADITFGVWDFQQHTFTPTDSAPNSIKVIARRASANGNAVSLFFARVLGITQVDVAATAIAALPGGTPQFRFLLDDEFIDSDLPSIETLARQLGVPPDKLISDENDDGFIDLPPGRTVELPTGQIGDEGLFDRTTFEGKFPFRSDSVYTMLDFLAEGTAMQAQLGTQPLQNKQWTSSNAPHPQLVGKKVLDPVPGCDPMDVHADILALPDSTLVYLSPVYKSDVSMAERNPDKYGSPAANLLGERRGLLAFKILSARSNPAGGSYLPLITIEVVDPESVDMMHLTDGSAGNSPKIVR